MKIQQKFSVSKSFFEHSFLTKQHIAAKKTLYLQCHCVTCAVISNVWKNEPNFNRYFLSSAHMDMFLSLISSKWETTYKSLIFLGYFLKTYGYFVTGPVSSTRYCNLKQLGGNWVPNRVSHCEVWIYQVVRVIINIHT